MVRLEAVRFKKLAAVFDEIMARPRRCDSSGSEHSNDGYDLSDLVNSFLEREGDDEHVGEEISEKKRRGFEGYGGFDSETNDALKSLIGCEEDDDGVKRKIRDETEEAWGVIGCSSTSSPVFKRRLMALLRDRGFDAGLCKSKWEKTGRFPSGKYEYIDVNVGGARYVIEINLSTEFEIARPTDYYSSLLETLPPIFVGKVDELKQVVRLICKAIKKSMKTVEMHIPPWRRHGYMRAKWLGSYKRTINEIPIKKASDYDENLAEKRSVGFVPVPSISYYCRQDFGSKIGMKVGNLTVAFNGTS